ncbi:hypothetical protein [unidentified bacterial endosymbiont]|uniref:hypothetical protein n=1 Tax=unidentified bacterial endosymbiont TaxID=2355 RepID=UPI0020A1E4C9|nr:hypothetical protein [unidentified bacterial endosymbiont]
MTKLIKTILLGLCLLNTPGAMAMGWPANDPAGGPDPGSREAKAAQERNERSTSQDRRNADKRRAELERKVMEASKVKGSYSAGK